MMFTPAMGLDELQRLGNILAVELQDL